MWQYSNYHRFVGDYAQMPVHTVIHEWILQLWTWEANGSEVINHVPCGSCVHYITKTQVRHTIQEWQDVGPDGRIADIYDI